MPERSSFTQRMDRVLADGWEFVERVRKFLPPPREHQPELSEVAGGRSESPRPTSKLKKQPRAPRS
jgi:hypothetical protein